MPADDKTEKATPKRRQEARKKGQVAKSTELNGAVVLVAGLIAISFFGPKIVSEIADSMQSSFTRIANAGSVTSAAGLHGLFDDVLHTMLVSRRADRRGLRARRRAGQRRPGRLPPVA